MQVSEHSAQASLVDEAASLTLTGGLASKAHIHTKRRSLFRAVANDSQAWSCTMSFLLLITELFRNLWVVTSLFHLLYNAPLPRFSKVIIFCSAGFPKQK